MQRPIALERPSNAGKMQNNVGVSRLAIVDTGGGQLLHRVAMKPLSKDSLIFQAGFVVASFSSKWLVELLLSPTGVPG